MEYWTILIKGKVLDINWQPSAKKDQAMRSLFQPRYIKVELRKLYKGGKFITAKKYSTIYIRFASLDRPLLEEGHIYVLSGFSFGTSLFMNPCSWTSKWSELSSGQRFGINRYFYWIYCGCKIVDCQNKLYRGDNRSCVWNRQNTVMADFLTKDGICMVTNGTHCKWKNFGLWVENKTIRM